MANRFWVGGTGTWNASDTTHWAAASNGAGGQSVPGSADTVTFDANSGGGVVTVATDFNISGIQCGAHTGTLDFSVNNNNVNVVGTFGGSGSGARTLKLGSAIITCQLFQLASVANLVLFDAGTSQIRFFNSIGSGGFQPSVTGLTFNKFIIGPATQPIGAIQFSGGIYNVNTLEFNNVNLGAVLQLNNNSNMTMLNSFYWKGSPRRPISIFVGSTPPGTINLGAGKTGIIEWAMIGGITFTGGGTFIAKNCFDAGGNTGITFNAPQSSPIGGM